MNKVEKIPAGYKVTKIDVIPEDWEVHEIEDVADVLSGKRIPKGRTLTENITPYPYITVSDMGAGSVNLENIRFVPEDVYPLIKKYRIFVDDIYISVAGTLGLIGTIPKQLNGANLTENADRLANIKCDKNYLLYILSSPLIQKRIDEVKTLGAQPKLALTRIRKFCVAIPKTKSEQTAISTVLSDTDELIEKLEKLIAKKKAIKQGAMQQILTGKKRLPGFSGKWEVKTIAESTECLDNLRVPLNEEQRLTMQGEVPYCGANGVLGYVNDFLIDDDIILIAEDGGYFDEYYSRPIAYRMIGKCWVNNHAHILKAKNNYDQEFIYYSLVHKNILSFLTSGTRAKLNKSEMYKIEINIPTSKPEQTAIAIVLSDMDAEIEKLEQKLDKYRQIKTGMMQQLLTGKIRLGKN